MKTTQFKILCDYFPKKDTGNKFIKFQRKEQSGLVG